MSLSVIKVTVARKSTCPECTVTLSYNDKAVRVRFGYRNGNLRQVSTWKGYAVNRLAIAAAQKALSSKSRQSGVVTPAMSAGAAEHEKRLLSAVTD